MSRPTYEITLDGKLVATKNAWNSACREIPKIIQNALKSGRAWEVSKQLERLDQWSFKSGVFNWLSDSNETFKIEIKMTVAKS